MNNLKKIFSYIPEVKKPDEKRVDFNTKFKWTLIVLVAFFVLSNIPLFGLSENALSRFEFLQIILAAEFGSLISLGVGPIVMASIILQLLTGSGILNIDLTKEEGKRFFQSLQKILVFFFIIFEAVVYVLMQGLQPAPGFTFLLIFQLILGGLAIFYMDELTTKWGFGSGVSLFIAAGVSRQIFTAAFQFIDQQGRVCLLNFKTIPCTGKVLVLIQSVINRLPTELLSSGLAIISTLIVFLVVVWAQSLKVEIPLSFGRLRGYSIKWPLSFFYASVIPVILTAALVANIQLFGSLIENVARPCHLGLECSGPAKIASYFGFLGRFVNGQPVSGLAFWIGSTNLLELFIRGGLLTRFLIQGIVHVLFFMIFSTLFAVFWVKTSGMDAKSQAHKIIASGLHVSGFRQDERILESILDRYIMPLTVMGGLAIGFLAAITNLIGALVSGTAVLLVIMIIFQFYQNIAQQHQMDMHPTLRKFIGS
ncbi:MAG: preprotein translocase subunit SecY [Candidatus Pacearchaeota archaeon]|nr:MAG: preprotein translocase subunit SecY [Candidatus Pacearchaeota archaeon]